MSKKYNLKCRKTGFSRLVRVGKRFLGNFAGLLWTTDYSQRTTVNGRRTTDYRLRTTDSEVPHLKSHFNMNKVSENPFKNRANSNTPLMLVTAVFATLYLVSNVMAVKVICILDYPTFDAGTITFPFAYMLGDVLTEIWGYRTAKKVIWITFLCNIILVACTQIGVWLPSPDYLQETANAYNHLFTYVPRIVVGSLVGFLLGELSNAWIMDWMKRKTEGKHLWFRTIGSSIVGYFFDTVPFVLIAFVGIVSTRDLLLMLATQYVMKLGIEAFFGTPMAYAVIAWVKRSIKRREQWNATH